MISPWINFECDTPSYEENAQLDISLNRDMLYKLGRIYTGEIPLEKSNPKNARLSQFPPVLIMVGTNEILLDDSRNFYNGIKGIQGRSRLSIYNDQPHVWLKKDIYKEASRRALAEIADFINVWQR